MKRGLGFVFVALFIALAARPASAYVLVLKDGSKIFGKAKYEVKHDFAVFTLENGNVAQIPMAKVDVAGTDRYNKENAGNVLVLDTPNSKVLETPKTTSTDRQNLSRYIQQHEAQPKAPRAEAPKSALPKKPAVAEISDPLIIREAIRILEGAGVTQYKLQIGPKVILIADQDDAVFRGISAAARLAQDLTSIGKAPALEVEIISSNGSEGGRFKMSADSVKDLTEGQITASEYFVKNVIF
jgi:hypothetical protein